MHFHLFFALSFLLYPFFLLFVTFMLSRQILKSKASILQFLLRIPLAVVLWVVLFLPYIVVHVLKYFQTLKWWALNNV